MRLSAPARAAFATFVRGQLTIIGAPMRPTDGAVPLSTRALRESHRAWVIERLPSVTEAVEKSHYKADPSKPGRVGEGWMAWGGGGGGEPARAGVVFYACRAVSHTLAKHGTIKVNMSSGYFNVTYKETRKGWMGTFRGVTAGPYAAAWAAALHLEFLLAKLAVDEGAWGVARGCASSHMQPPPPTAPCRSSPHSPATLQASPATPWCPTCTTSWQTAT
jgi:hypothetical protein